MSRDLGPRIVDYFALISRAVQSLDESTKDARRSVYGCARTLLTDNLRSAEPALSELDIAGNLASLEEAIRRVESEELEKWPLEQSHAQHHANFDPGPTKLLQKHSKSSGTK